MGIRVGSVGWAAALLLFLAACSDDKSAALNPCAGVTCSGKGLCAPQPAGPVCVCAPGYEPRGLECVPAVIEEPEAADEADDDVVEPEEDIPDLDDAPAPTPCLNNFDCRTDEQCDINLAVCRPAVGVLRGGIDSSIADPADARYPGGDGPGRLIGRWRGDPHVFAGVATAEIARRGDVDTLKIVYSQVLSAEVTETFTLYIPKAAIRPGETIAVGDAGAEGFLEDKRDGEPVPELLAVLGGGFFRADLAELEPKGRVLMVFDLDLAVPPVEKR